MLEEIHSKKKVHLIQWKTKGYLMQWQNRRILDTMEKLMLLSCHGKEEDTWCNRKNKGA
jgi:hypothetical protein